MNKNSFTGFGVAISLVLGCLPVPMMVCETASAQTTSDRKVEANRLLEKGTQLYQVNKYQEAFEAWEQALQIYRGIKDLEGERALINVVDRSNGQYKNALEFYQIASSIHKQRGDRAREADTLSKLGEIYVNTEKYAQAIELHQRALILFRELGVKEKVAETLGFIGQAYFKSGKYQKIVDLFSQQLSNLKKIGDLETERYLLKVMQDRLRQDWGFSAAKGTSADSDIQSRTSKDLSWEESLGISHLNAFIIQNTGSDPSILSETFHGIGWSYRNLGNYSKALKFYQDSLKIQKASKNIDPFSIQLLMIDIGTVNIDLGQYDLALQVLQESLSFQKFVLLKGQWSMCKCNALGKIGFVYKLLGQNDKALKYLHEALDISDTFTSYPGAFEKQNVLNNLGEIYSLKGDYKKALKFYQNALDQPDVSGDQSAKGFIFNNIGLLYSEIGDYNLSIQTFHKALGTFRKLKDRPGERITLRNMGKSLKKQNQPELAIVFYKQAVNITESIRQGLKQLSPAEQKSYVKTVSETYRSLADLLLSQGRILEAQQVLELLKVEEIRAYTRNTRAVDDTNGIATNKTETKTIDKHNSLIALGLRVDECEQKKCPELRQLMQQRDIISTEYDQATKVLIKEIRDRKTNDDQFFDPRKVAKMNEIVSAQPNTILIYPLILKDKIWILWAAKGGITKSFEVPNVGLEKVSSNVLKLRTLLQSPENLAELQQTSQQLYNWLIPPELQAELKANKIEHLVFAPDSVTRYIPMGVLFDGKQYLIENYTIATIISADLTDTTARLPATQNTSILAAGLSQSVAGYSPLPHVLSEINAIVRTAADPSKGIYDGIKLLDRDFTKQSLKENLGNYAIVHIATHGKFVSGDAEQSFLVLGNGEKLPIPEIEKFRGLSKLHLVVLSACQTALGGTIGDGTEIAGISYYFLTVGAKAVIASLWEVSDDSTSLLMQQFYNNLAKSTTSAPVTKVEAIRQAQLSLLKEKITPKENIQRGNLAVVYRGGSKPSDNYSHPYYWAPFILIGNSL